jgi:hypothetical protein
MGKVPSSQGGNSLVSYSTAPYVLRELAVGNCRQRPGGGASDVIFLPDRDTTTEPTNPMIPDIARTNRWSVPVLRDPSTGAMLQSRRC